MEEVYDKLQDLMFNDVDEVFQRKAEIRENYMHLDFKSKQVYKWFFFCQLSFVKNPLKRLLWDFINEVNDLSIQHELLVEYQKFCDKRVKMYGRHK